MHHRLRVVRVAGAEREPDLAVRHQVRAVGEGDRPLRALLDQQDVLERQIAELRLKKDTMDPAQYEAQFEKLATDLALKTREIRDLQTKK